MTKYVLGENAARFLREQMANARGYQPAQPLPSRQLKRDMSTTSTGGPNFHLRFIVETETDNGTTTTTYSIGEGAVQIGGYTYFTAGGEIANLGSGTQYVCAVVALGAGTVTFAAYASTALLNVAQSDMSKYIFPLYRLNNYSVEMDYRPMPNAGCWEIAESEGGSGSSGSGSSGGGSA